MLNNCDRSMKKQTKNCHRGWFAKGGTCQRRQNAGKLSWIGFGINLSFICNFFNFFIFRWDTCSLKQFKKNWFSKILTKFFVNILWFKGKVLTDTLFLCFQPKIYFCWEKKNIYNNSLFLYLRLCEEKKTFFLLLLPKESLNVTKGHTLQYICF